MGRRRRGRTSELVQILESLGGVDGIAGHVSSIDRAVVLQLLHARAHVVEGLHGILWGDAASACMFGVLADGGSSNGEVAGEEIGEDEVRLGGSLGEAVCVEDLESDGLEYLARARVHEIEKRGESRES